VDTIIERAASHPARAIVITGGEPSHYPLYYLTTTLKNKGLEIFVETSGVNPLDGIFDWICLSPKRQSPPLAENLARANELKIIVEGPEDFAWAEANAARVMKRCKLFLQPEWSRYEEMIPRIVDYAKAHPEWNVSLQTHKFMHIP
jgi:organic radical activating enzyme